MIDEEKITAATTTLSELLIDGSDSRFREMVHDLLAFAARLEGVRSCFGEVIGLRGVQYSILITIKHLQGECGVGVTTVSQHLALSGPFITTEVARLVKLGLVVKASDPEDRRRVRLLVSDRGHQALNGLTSVQQEVNDILFEPVSRIGLEEFGHLSKELRLSSERALALADYLSSPASRGGKS